MLALQAAATTLLAMGTALAATYLRSVEFFQHPLLQALGLPLGIILAVSGAILLGVGAMRLRAKSNLRAVTLEVWTCQNCDQTNEGSLAACWSCGLPYQLRRGPPTHIPVEARWKCPRCQVWNGVLRPRCWYCDGEHDSAVPSSSTTEGRVRRP